MCSISNVSSLGGKRAFTRGHVAERSRGGGLNTIERGCLVELVYARPPADMFFRSTGDARARISDAHVVNRAHQENASDARRRQRVSPHIIAFNAASIGRATGTTELPKIR